MTITTPTQFSKDFLVGSYLKRQGRAHRHSLTEIGITKEALEELRSDRNNHQQCAQLIGQYAKESFLQDLDNAPYYFRPISLAQRVKYITAHVYNGSTFLGDSEEKVLTTALNEAISLHAQNLLQECIVPQFSIGRFSSGNSILKSRISYTKITTKEYNKFIADRLAQIDLIKSTFQEDSSSWNPIKRFSTWRARSQILHIQEKLDAAKHTNKILTHILENTELHTIRTQDTSSFQVKLKPLNDQVGKGYQGLSVSFIPHQTTTAPAVVNLSCTLLPDGKDGYPGRTIPIQIQTSSTTTKWLLVEVPDNQAIPQIIQDFLKTEEGKQALKEAEKSSWSEIDEAQEAHYRHRITNQTDTTKQHTIFGRHVYVSSDKVLLGRQNYEKKKYNGFLTQGGMNNVYNAKTIDFSSGSPQETSHIVRKARKDKPKKPQDIKHQQEIYTLLQGCPNVAVPTMKIFHTLKNLNERMLEVMPLCNKGSLKQFSPTQESQKLDICLQAATGVAAMHEKGVWHGDLKPDNILVHQKTPTDPLQIYISDVDDAALFGYKASAYTPDYLAPECKKTTDKGNVSLDQTWKATDKAVVARDAWALGLSLFETIYKSRKNFPSSNTFSEEAKNPLSQASSAEKRDYIISRLLDTNPATRMTVEEARNAFQTISDFESL